MAAREPLNEGVVMLDDNSQSWLTNHLEFLLGLFVMVGTWLVFFVRLSSRVDDNAKDLETLREDHNTLDDQVSAHLTDIRRHIDPERDERRWQELREDIRYIKEKLR
jgi:hypothetical protein